MATSSCCNKNRMRWSFTFITIFLSLTFCHETHALLEPLGRIIRKIGYGNNQPGFDHPLSESYGSIKMENGEIYDCVEYSKQQGLQHPLLKDYKPILVNQTTSTIFSVLDQECPDGTVPVARRKFPGTKMGINHPLMADGGIHHYAVAEQSGKFLGTRALLNIWKPKVPLPTQFSLSQIWVTSARGPNKNTIEAGWHVYKNMYGDDNVHFFTFWTVNDYKTPCYNQNCKGYVQVAKHLAPGMVIKDVSVYGGKQIHFEIKISKDAAAKAWQLKVDNVLIGYWPEDVLPQLKGGAAILQWGGEVVSPPNTKQQDFPPMGSGHRPDNNPLNRVCYTGQIKVIEPNGSEQNFKPTTYIIDLKSCYDLSLFTDGFYFGGTCPKPKLQGSTLESI